MNKKLYKKRLFMLSGVSACGTTVTHKKTARMRGGNSYAGLVPQSLTPGWLLVR